MVFHEMLATWVEAGFVLMLGGMLWQLRSQNRHIERLYKMSDQLRQLVVRHDEAIALFLRAYPPRPAARREL